MPLANPNPKIYLGLPKPPRAPRLALPHVLQHLRLHLILHSWGFLKLRGTF